MSGLIIGIILGAGYFTYKPLFKHLKANKFSPKDLYQSIKDNAEVRQEFKDFSMGQMEKIKELLAKFSKGKDNEIVHYQDGKAYTIKTPIQATTPQKELDNGNTHNQRELTSNPSDTTHSIDDISSQRANQVGDGMDFGATADRHSILHSATDDLVNKQNKSLEDNHSQTPQDSQTQETNEQLKTKE
ncbi:hypothetical protein [uncultured Helicobacter sp.]|uniref:hypothetical protein n=1 Tax=uncultured Helicobacter sp. TaxID=175537 RepID=UPI00374E8275